MVCTYHLSKMVIFLGDGFNLSVLPTLLGAFHGNFHGRFIGIVHGKKFGCSLILMGKCRFSLIFMGKNVDVQGFSWEKMWIFIDFHGKYVDFHGF